MTITKNMKTLVTTDKEILKLAKVGGIDNWFIFVVPIGRDSQSIGRGQLPLLLGEKTDDELFLKVYPNLKDKLNKKFKIIDIKVSYEFTVKELI